MPRLTKEQKEEARKLYYEWEDWQAKVDQAEAKADALRRRLTEEYNVDPYKPPDWL